MSHSKKIIDCLAYSVKHDDKFFIDANIFIPFLDANYDTTFGDRDLMLKSQRFFKKIIDKKAKIYILPELVSECFNRYIKQNYKIKFSKQNYKIFRKSADFKKFAEDFKLQLNSLIEYEVVEFDSFKLEKDEVIEFFREADRLDFNDFLFVKYALRKGLIFVTNDKDLTVKLDGLKSVLSLDENLVGKRY